MALIALTPVLRLRKLLPNHTFLDAFFFDETDNWYQHNVDVGNVFNNSNNYYFTLSATIKMAAGVDVVAQVQVANGSKVIDVYGAYLSIHLDDRVPRWIKENKNGIPRRFNRR